ncbi:MAG: hypothetical protein QXU95_00265 [Candidatus Bathyarchaeia archaeon]
MSSASLTLPFAVPAKDNGEGFTLDMEVAAVLLLAEAERRKTDFSEMGKTLFVSKLHYPLWLIPWENASLLIDGLGAISSSIICQKLPDVSSFIEDLERSISNRVQFWFFIEKHKRTFADFAGKIEFSVESLISDRELLSEISEYMKETTSMHLEENFSALLIAPKLDEGAAIERTRQLLSIQRQAISEISCLEYAEGLLRKVADTHERVIQKEIDLICKSYNEEISKIHPAVDMKVNRLLKEMDAKIAKIRKNFKKEIEAKEKEKERHEHKLQDLEIQKADFSRRRDFCKRRKDKIGLARWEHKIQVCENRIRELKKKINNLTEYIKEISRQNQAAVEKLRGIYQEQIEKEKSKITSLEIQHEEKIKSKKGEIESLEREANQIISQIQELIKRKREWMRELKQLTIPWQVEHAALIRLPLYLIGYQSEREIDLHILPPIKVASPKGVTKALRKTLLGLTRASKLTLFIQPRSEALSKMLNSVLKEKVKLDENFRGSLYQTASLSNILKSQNLRETIIKGLEKLKAGDWVGQGEIDAIMKAYLGG